MLHKDQVFESFLKPQFKLHEFLKQGWRSIEGDVPFIDNWHLQAIAEHLEACSRREIKNLIINVPPRSSKTSIVSVAFPVFCWLTDPSLKFIYASYARSLSLEHSLKCRRLIESDWFQSLWGDRFKLTSDQNTKSLFENDHKGYRMSTSVGAAVTGSGGNILVVDDGNSAKDAQSEIKREGTNQWWDQVWSTRLNDPKNDVRIVVQQRVHENDITGHILKNDTKQDWVKLILPMEFESARRSKTIVLPSTAPNIWEDPRKKEGALLMPARFGVSEVLKLRAELGSYGYSGQCQQRPAPLEGGILKKNWFKLYTEKIYPKLELVIQSWDTAFSDKPDAAYSACSTYGIFKYNGVINILLLSCWRGRVGYPELRDRAKRLFKNYLDIDKEPKTTSGQFTVNRCIIESKATGDPLLRDLKLAGIHPTPYSPRGDKEARVQQVSAYIEAGIVHYADRPENKEFIEEMAKFPNASSRDYVDTLTQLLGFLRENNMLTIPKDPELFETKTNNTIPYFKTE